MHCPGLIKMTTDEVDTELGHLIPSTQSLESSQSSYETGNHSFFKSMHQINDFESVGAKVEEYDVLRLPPSSPVPETSSMSPYEMEDLQNHEYLISSNQRRNRET